MQNISPNMFYKYKLCLSLFNIFFNKQDIGEYHCISPTVIRGKKTVPAVINSNWWKTHADCIVHLRAFCDAQPFLHFHAIWPWPFLAAVILCQSAHNQCLSPSVWSQKQWTLPDRVSTGSPVSLHLGHSIFHWYCDTGTSPLINSSALPWLAHWKWC